MHVVNTPFSKYRQGNLAVKHAIIANTAVAMNVDNATIFRPASAHQARPRGYDKISLLQIH